MADGARLSARPGSSALPGQGTARDNGSEFLNDHLVRFFGETITGLQLSRSRPYQKNDNRFVEQQNSTLVRAYLQTAWLDPAAQAAVLNTLYSGGHDS